jgi:hypothetical protein
MESALNAGQALMGWACECQGELEGPVRWEYSIENCLSKITRCLGTQLRPKAAALHLVKNSDTHCS